jgi:hypothetical protein
LLRAKVPASALGRPNAASRVVYEAVRFEPQVPLSPRYLRIVNHRHTIHLRDGAVARTSSMLIPDDDRRDCLTVWCTSARSGPGKELKHIEDSPAPSPYYMAPWSIDELKRLHSISYTNLLTAELVDWLFALYGGVPRTIFDHMRSTIKHYSELGQLQWRTPLGSPVPILPVVQLNPLSNEQQQICLEPLEQAIADLPLAAQIQTFLRGGLVTKTRWHLLQLVPSALNDPSRYQVSFASRYAAYRVVEHYRSSAALELRTWFVNRGGDLTVEKIRGVVYEIAMHNELRD